MTKCCIRGCNANSRKNEDLSFFRFPKNEALHTLWIRNIGKENIKRAAVVRICSKHFEAKFINRTLSVVRLKDNVVPTLFPFTSPSVQSGAALSMNTANTENKIEMSLVKMEKNNQKTATVIQQQRKKIKMLQQTCRRLKHKVLTLQTVIEALHKQNLINRDGTFLLEECAGSRISARTTDLKNRGVLCPRIYGKKAESLP